MVAARDHALRDIAWRDLLPMSRLEIAHEIAICLPWLVGSVVLYSMGLVPLGMIGSFFAFLTGLRLSHGCQHYQLPVARHWQDKTLFVLSVVMLTSMHAVQATHLNHHRHCLDDKDFEGRIAHRPMWFALLTGPLFPLRLHTEHHLFPAVPTCHLHTLASRIDRETDAYRRVLVLPARSVQNESGARS